VCGKGSGDSCKTFRLAEFVRERVLSALCQLSPEPFQQHPPPLPRRHQAIR